MFGKEKSHAPFQTREDSEFKQYIMLMRKDQKSRCYTTRWDETAIVGYRVQRGSPILHAEMDTLENAGRRNAAFYRESTLFAVCHV